MVQGAHLCPLLPISQFLESCPTRVLAAGGIDCGVRSNKACDHTTFSCYRLFPISANLGVSCLGFPWVEPLPKRWVRGYPVTLLTAIVTSTPPPLQIYFSSPPALNRPRPVPSGPWLSFGGKYHATPTPNPPPPPTFFFFILSPVIHCSFYL